MPETATSNNRLLAALPTKEYQLMLPKLEQFSLSYAEILYNPGDTIRHVYFPESGIVSLLSAVEENSTLEVGIVGDEGMIGLPVFLGIATSNTRALVQGAGFALRMPAKDFIKAAHHSRELTRVLQRYTHSLITQISQSAVCYLFHPIEARLARWLLMTSDRVKALDFTITQGFLSNMLGVRREAVNKAAGSFHKQQLISYKRGHLTILNRADLEERTCLCYQILKKDYDNFLK